MRLVGSVHDEAYSLKPGDPVFVNRFHSRLLSNSAVGGCGAELWVVGHMSQDASGRPGAYDDPFHSDDGVIWEPVILQKGEAM